MAGGEKFLGKAEAGCAACARCNAARLTARAESEGWDAWDDLTRPPLGRRWHHAPGSGRSWRGWPWTDAPDARPLANVVAS